MATNTFEAVQEYRTNTDIDVAQLQANLVTQQAFIPRNPAWVARYPIGDVTFPEFLMMKWDIVGTSGAASAGTAHTHAIGTYETQPVQVAVAQNVSFGSYVTISNGYTIDTVAMYLFRVGATVPNNVFIEVFREASGGALTRVAISADISASLLNNVVSYIERAVTPFVAQAGERYLVRVRNSTSVVVTLGALGMGLGSGATRNAFATLNSTDTNKTSYTAGEALTAQGATPQLAFAALGATGLATTEESYSDDFNRTTMGGLWTKDTLAVISNGRASYGSSGSAGVAWATYNRNTISDNQRVEARFYDTANLASAGQGLFLNASSNRLNCVALYVQDTIGSGGTAKIYSYSGGTGTQRATVSLSMVGQGEAIWTLYYETSANRYTVLRNGVAIGLTWTDSGNIITHGELNRYGGLFVEQAMLILVPIKGGTIDSWNLRDYTP